MSADPIFADNPLCQLLGIRYPICQAGMYQVAYGSLAAAVANAGGLGMIGSAYMPPARLREEIRVTKAQTDKPFGVDILFAKTTGAGATIQAYEREVRAHIDVTFEEEVPIIVSGLGDPGAIAPVAPRRHEGHGACRHSQAGQGRRAVRGRCRHRLRA